MGGRSTCRTEAVAEIRLADANAVAVVRAPLVALRRRLHEGESWYYVMVQNRRTILETQGPRIWPHLAVPRSAVSGDF